jgi:hypothetical protein
MPGAYLAVASHDLICPAVSVNECNAIIAETLNELRHQKGLRGLVFREEDNGLSGKPCIDQGKNLFDLCLPPHLVCRRE